MEKQGVIRPSKSPYSYNFQLIAKSDGTMRPIVNYRPINERLWADAGPIPNPDDMRLRLHLGAVFSAIDLKKGYWQIALQEQERKYTAFWTPIGLYEYLVLPFGLYVAPAIFQRFLNETLAEFLNACVVVYIDDILIYSRNQESHIKDVEAVLKCLLKRGLILSLDKCFWGVKCVCYIGLLLTSNGMKLANKSREKLKALVQPQNYKILARFLGLTNYYRRFVEIFSHRTSLLRKRLQQVKDSPEETFNLDHAELAEYDGLIKVLTAAPIFCRPDISRNYMIDTDACKRGISAILQQEFEGRLSYY